MKQLLNIYLESYLHVDLRSRVNYLSLESKPLWVRNTVKSLYSGHCRDLDHELVSSLERVAGNYISQTSVIYFFPGFSCCPYYRMSVIAAGCPQSESWLYTHPWRPRGGLLGQEKRRRIKSGRESPWEATLSEPVSQLISMIVAQKYFLVSYQSPASKKYIIQFFFLPPLSPPPPHPLPLPTIPKLWISSIKVRFWRPWFLNRLYNTWYFCRRKALNKR